MKIILRSAMFALYSLAGMPLSLHADVVPLENGDLLDFSKPENLSAMKPKKVTASVIPEGGANCIKVDIASGPKYPGLRLLTPSKEDWNLNGCSAVETKISNTGSSEVTLALRVDNPAGTAEEPWITSAPVTFAPGETKTISVKLTPSKKKQSYTLDPAHIAAVNIFAIEPQTAASVLIRSLKAVR